MTPEQAALELQEGYRDGFQSARVPMVIAFLARSESYRRGFQNARDDAARFTSRAARERQISNEFAAYCDTRAKL